METETGVSNDCQMISELSDKQKKKSGKKKRKSRNQENELKNNDSHITSQKGNADEAFSSGKKIEGEPEKSTNEDQVHLSENRDSTLAAESCQRDSISCEEPGATLHHTDPIFSAREDSLPDANNNGSIKKRTKRRGKKKKDGASCDAGKTTKEDQVHPPDNPLSNHTIQEESREHTQDACEKHGAAHLCTEPNLSMRVDSQPDATKMTSSGRRKEKRERDTNTLEESGVDIHSTMAQVAAKYNTISEAQGSKSMSKEEKSVKSKDDSVEQQEGTNVKLNETAAQTQTPKAKKRKKRKTKTVEVCDSLGNTLETSMKSGSVECVESNDGNSGRELVSNLASQRKNSATGEETSFHNLDITKERETDDKTEVKKDVLEVKHNTISEAEGTESMIVEEKSVSSVVIDSCVKSKDDTVEQRECTDVKLNETVAQTQIPKAKKRKKRKTKTVEVCNPLGNTLATAIKSGSVECVVNNDVNGGLELMSQKENAATGEEIGFQNREKTKEKESDENTEVREDALEIKQNTIPEAEGSKSINIEEKFVPTVVVNSCPKSKDDTVEQRECADVKLNETVAQTHNPKAKKRKKRNITTVEVCDPLGNTMPTSTESGTVECVEYNDGNAGREVMSYSVSLREKSATREGRGLQNIEKSREKETDENTEVKEDVLGAGACDVRSKKRKGKKKKTSYADHKTTDMEVCDRTGSVECLLDHSNKEDMQNCEGNAGQFGGKHLTSKIEQSATKEKSGVQKSGKRKEMTKDENIESNQDALGAEGVSDVGRKRHKRKSNKNTNSKSVVIMDSEPVQCLLYHSNRKGEENCNGNADGVIASKDLASKLEDSANKGESVEDVENANKNKKDEKGEVDQDALGAGAISKDEVKTKKSKKKKNSLDHKTDNMEDEMKIDEKREVEHKTLGAEGVSKVEVKTKKSKKKKSSLDHKIDNTEEKADVALPTNDEEPEFDREKLETSSSSSVLIQNIVAKEVASLGTGDVPRCSCEGQRPRKLLIFDLNGILADIVQGYTGQFVPDGKVSYRSVFRRPFVSSFLDFCFERFEVAIWSSRRIGLDYMINIVMENYSRNLLFCFDQNNCTTTKFKTQEKNDKPLFLKDLRRVWERFGTCISCGKRRYDEANTLLIDDSPDKALCNPTHTGIFPCPYQYKDSKDTALGPEGELRKYLERLVDAENVQKFVAENPYGQTAITETHKSWEFYSEVVEAHK